MHKFIHFLTVLGILALSICTVLQFRTNRAQTAQLNTLAEQLQSSQKETATLQQELIGLRTELTDLISVATYNAFLLNHQNATYSETQTGGLSDKMLSAIQERSGSLINRLGGQ